MSKALSVPFYKCNILYWVKIRYPFVEYIVMEKYQCIFIIFSGKRPMIRSVSV